MEVKATLHFNFISGQNGSKPLLKRHGDQRVNVRYRYDKPKHQRYKTVEFSVGEQGRIASVRIQLDQRVHLRIGYGELELPEAIPAN